MVELLLNNGADVNLKGKANCHRAECIDNLDHHFSTQITPRPIFLRKNFHDPKLRTFIICRPSTRVVLPCFQQKNLYNRHAQDPFKILHDPSVEKNWFRLNSELVMEGDDYFRVAFEASVIGETVTKKMV